MSQSYAAASSIAAPAVSLATRVQAAMLAGGLGLVMLLGVAFAPLEIIHNAAHDTRHTIAVPCH